MKKWIVSQFDRENAKQIAEAYNLPPIIATLLQIRGITNEDEIISFLTCDNELFDPFLIADMDKAVARINKAISENQLICVYGDYDADGVTSTALLYSYLVEKSANVMYYIPSREKEGYGINKVAIDYLSQKNVSLIVTVDNGISALTEIAYASTLGIDTVITDHHTVPEIIPNAVAVVDMHRKDCDSPYKYFSGVGVVFKLIMALEDDFLDIEDLLNKYSDIVALGTIGDIVPLTGENRVFVKNGLQHIFNCERNGITALLNDAGLIGSNKLSAGRISYTIIPRINACGRLALSEKSVKLLLTKDKSEAEQIAAELGEDNKIRQGVEKEILGNICSLLTEKPYLKYDRVIVIDGEGWHQGVIGIVASRIKEIFGKPTIIISSNGEVSKGSGRSIKGFSLYDAIVSCKSYLTHFGGHPMAVGLSLNTCDINNFRIAINKYANSLDEPIVPTLEIDCKLNPAVLSVDIVSDLSVLEPYGAGNSAPLFGLFNMTLTAIVPVGGGKHLRLQLSRESTKITAMYFFVTPEEFEYKIGAVVDLAVTLDVNNFNNVDSLSIIIKDIKPANVDYEQAIFSKYVFEDFCQGNSISEKQKESLIPSREDFALIYRYIRSNKCENINPQTICYKINNNSITYGKLMVVLTALNQLQLIQLTENFEKISIAVLPSVTKVDLQSAQIIKNLTV